MLLIKEIRTVCPLSDKMGKSCTRVMAKLLVIGQILLMGSVFLPSALMAQPELIISDKGEVVKHINELYANGKWEEGKELAEEKLSKYPKDSDLKMLIGKYYVHRKDYDKARLELNRSIRYNRENVDARHLLVTVETETGRYSSAICYVNELLEINPYWKGLWRKKIALFRLQGNDVEANRLQKRINQIFPGDGSLKKDYLYQLEMEAHANRKAGDMDKAIQLSKELVAENPENIDNYLNAANDYLKAGDRDGALAFVERGLVRFPKNEALINKKAGILAEQHRYNDLLAFLQHEKRYPQYGYYLQEAARDARNRETATLYGKMLAANPGNREAFRYVFNDAVKNGQYEEALLIIKRHREARGASRELSLKEMMVYNRMGNTGRANALAKELFRQYGHDTDIREAYANAIFSEARDKMEAERYNEAIADWEQVILYGDEELVPIARKAMFDACVAAGDYNNALHILDELALSEPDNPHIYVQRADIYFRKKDYNQAFSWYEKAIERAEDRHRPIYLGGYADMGEQVVSNLNGDFRYQDAMQFVKRWLKQEPENGKALRYAVNLSHKTGNREVMRMYAEQGNKYHPENVFFKTKLAELRSTDADFDTYEEVYGALHIEVRENPYHETLINTFSQTAENYGLALIREKQGENALDKINTALFYAPDNKSLKYAKGLAFEQLKQYDSAYYYQAFYEPSDLEHAEFRAHLNYLQNRTYKNEVTLSHFRSRRADHNTANTPDNTISSVGYSRFEGRDTYTGRVYYTGRETGRGIQLQGEWLRDWNKRTSTMVNAAWSDMFFPMIAANASVYRYYDILGGIQFELGAGYRRFRKAQWATDMTDGNMYNVVAGATREWDRFRLNARYHQFYLDEALMYSLSLDARHYFASYKGYVMAVGSIGSAPDVDLINYQLFNAYSVPNTMIGAGFGHTIHKNVSGSILGSINNFRVSDEEYRNLFNLYFQVNVLF